MQRAELAGVSEEFQLAKVGRSTMAQKRNPSTALLLVSLARMLRARVPLAMESLVCTRKRCSATWRWRRA